MLLVVDDLVLCTVLFSFILTSHSRSCFYPLLHPPGGGCPDLLSLLFHPPLRTISRFTRCCLDQIWQNREGGEVKRKVQELRRVQEGCRSFEIRKMKSLRNGEYSATVMWRVKGTFCLLFPPIHSSFCFLLEWKTWQREDLRWQVRVRRRLPNTVCVCVCVWNGPKTELKPIRAHTYTQCRDEVKQT